MAAMKMDVKTDEALAFSVRIGFATEIVGRLSTVIMTRQHVTPLMRKDIAEESFALADAMMDYLEKEGEEEKKVEEPSRILHYHDRSAS